ncbi:MAG: ABC transporter permease [Cyclobacteriaceae bacterium]|nr:ABC transporter permease [Cyclobacteriaceae bacterium]
MYSTSGISKVFTFKFIDGSEDGFEVAQTALISETNAKNWFGDARKAVGQVIKMQQADVTVVGVFKDFPQTSHFNPKFIVKIPERWQVHTKWDWPAYYTYVKIITSCASCSRILLSIPAMAPRYFCHHVSKTICCRLQSRIVDWVSYPISVRSSMIYGPKKRPLDGR